ncbi:hypothetical protein [Salinisphaera aquimarina]|uniref:Uncharacterized protein n=1 Tax=Salinisphaera aquimarina TaxID=2094031 RepID=A0ABV7ENU5_9GAMM
MSSCVSHPPLRQRLAGWLAASSLLFVSAAWAAEAPDTEESQPYRLSDTWSTPFADEQTRLSAEELESNRGGFVTREGFEFSLGLTSLQRINDEPVVTRSLLAVKDVIGSLNSGTTTSTATPKTSTVVQLGPGNVIEPSLLVAGSSLPHTIIQNSLDHQHIQNATVYDFQLNNVGALTRALNTSVRNTLVGQHLVDSIH